MVNVIGVKGYRIGHPRYQYRFPARVQPSTQFIRLCCKNAWEETMSVKPHFFLSLGGAPNRLVMKATCPSMSPFSTPRICPFLIMYIPT
jgi:hypothetical protein